MSVLKKMDVDMVKSLITTKIQKVKFSDFKKTLTVVINEELPVEEEKYLQLYLKEKLGEGLELIIEHLGQLDLETLATVEWRSFVLQATKDYPSAKPWLLTARKNFDTDRISLFITNALGVEVLQESKFVEVLSKECKASFGIDVAFDISLDEIPNDCGLEDVKNQVMKDLHAKPASSGNKIGKAVNEVLLGRGIAKESRPIVSVVEEEKNVIICGEVFSFENRELKSGRKLLTFEVTDYTDSMAIKIFLETKNENIASDIRKGMWLKIKGLVQHDKFTQELTLFPSDIVIISPEERSDESKEKRIEFHVHTKMSALDSVVDLEKLIKLAKKFGHKAIAITDHGVVQAFPDAHVFGQKNGVKIIYGVEGYLIDDEEIAKTKPHTHHIILLAKNMIGLYNLYKLITFSHLNCFYRRPRIPKSELLKHREGIIIGSACEAGEVFQAILRRDSDNELEEVAAFYDYLEIQPTANNKFLIDKGLAGDVTELQQFNKRIFQLGKKMGKPVLATCDVHFLNPEDAIYRQILQAGKGFEDDKQAPLFFRTTEEMLKEFMYLGEENAWEVVVKNPNELEAQIEELKPIPDTLHNPEIEGAEEQIKEMTMNTAHQLYGEILPDVVQQRLDKELNSIIKHGFAVLYLIAQKLVKKSNDDGYLVGSRGSVGSSFVATMTKITEVNPLPPHYRCEKCLHSEFILDGSVASGADLPAKNCPKCQSILKRDGHDIPFEVFLGFEGDKVPDIDLNFSGEYQPRAHKYVEELFGKDNVFRAGTIATIAEKTAFGFVKNFLDSNNRYARGAEINRLIKGCSGVKRTTGQHPGGMMVVPKNVDIHRFTPLQRPADDTSSDIITTHFDYHSISSRLVKLDILGHDDPTVIKMLEDITGLNSQTILLGEPETMKIFSGVESLKVSPEAIRSQIGTYGIPEFGTKFVRQMLEDTRPVSFSELVRISGFSHGTDVWINNAQELIKSKTAKVSEAISTRDDIMVYLLYKNLPPKTAFNIMEDVRKGKGIKPEYEPIMKQHNVPQWYIDSCKKIKYMFPKAHAVAYVTMAYRIAYFKVYYPEAFYTTYFTVRADEFDADLICKGESIVRKSIEDIERKGNTVTQKEKNLLSILEIALEMYCRNIRLLNVDIIESDATKFLLTSQGILPPLASLQGVGSNAAISITTARKEGIFKTIEDLKNRSKAGKTVIEALNGHGCLKNLPASDQLTLFNTAF